MDFFNKLFGFKKEEDFASASSNDNKVMGDLKKKHSDVIDFSKAGLIIKEILNNKK